MIGPSQVAFLQEKIMTLEQALFFTLGDAVLRLPTSLVTVLQVDDVGQVWFAVKRPTQSVGEFDKEFAARLEFYKKGIPYYLHANGRATIVCDPEEINNAIGIPAAVKNGVPEQRLLIRMQVMDVAYYACAKVVKTQTSSQPLAFFKTLQYIVKDIIPVFQSH